MEKKGIIRIAYHQGKVFKKFKDKEKFITLVNKLGIHKTTIIFKINIFKLCERHSKLLKSSIGLGFLKTHYKDIQEICNENEQEFPYLICTNFCTFTQKNPFARENQYRIYPEKSYARNLIRTKIISFHLIYFEPFQKLLF